MYSIYKDIPDVEKLKRFPYFYDVNVPEMKEILKKEEKDQVKTFEDKIKNCVTGKNEPPCSSVDSKIKNFLKSYSEEEISGNKLNLYLKLKADLDLAKENEESKKPQQLSCSAKVELDYENPEMF